MPLKRLRETLNGFVPGRFRDRIALVVGGAQGIGGAIAERLALEGAHVIIADIDRTMMARTTKKIIQARGRAEAIYCDVRSQSQVGRMVSKVIRQHGRIDVLMHVAGVAEPVPFTRMDEKLWDSTQDINVKGAFLVARAVIPHMVKRHYGKLVFMASTNSWDAEAELAHYNVSKAGVFLLAKTLAREFGSFGINSNALGPGFIRTRLSKPFLQHPRFVSKYKELIPVGRLGEPEDVAGPAAFLASKDADYINGVLLFVDGGQLA